MITLTYDKATAIAKRTSRETSNLVQVRQIAPNGFGVFVLGLPKSSPLGNLIAIYRNGGLVPNLGYKA